MIKNNKLLCSILSGFFIGTSYIPFFPWASLFCCVPLWFYWSQTSSYKNTFISGWIAQFLLTLIGFNWVAYTIHEFGQVPWFPSLLGLLVFASLAHLYFPISGLISQYIIHKFNIKTPLSKTLLFAVSLFSCQEVLSLIFHWNFGYTWMWSKLPLYQTAEWFGFTGLSLITLIFNGLLTVSLIEWKRNSSHSKEAVFIPLFIVLFAFTSLNLAGIFLVKQIPKEDKTLEFSLIQANIGNQEKHYAADRFNFRQSILNNYLELSRQALEDNRNIQFLVWPETAYPTTLLPKFWGHHLQKQVKDFINETNTPLITGSYSKVLKQPTNSLFYLSPQKEDPIVGRYNKTQLLAFGEYVPFVDDIPALKKAVRKVFPTIASFQKGKGPEEVTSFLGFQFGSQICYESLFPRFSTTLSKNGAQVLINVTNDSWYGPYQEPFQHLYMTLARAIETRRPLIRSTNTGISSVITARGDILLESPIGEKNFFTVKLPLHSNPPVTLYQKIPFMDWILAGLALLMALIFHFKKKADPHSP